jgi:hypothetical protein
MPLLAALQVEMSLGSALPILSHLKPNETNFWFMMQEGMIRGFFTAYPVNILLIGKRWKQKQRMPPDERK